MKKFFAAVICLCLPIFFLVGCFNNTPKHETENLAISFAAQSNSSIKELFSENHVENQSVYDRAVEAIDEVNNVLVLYVSMAALISSYEKLGVSVNIKVIGDSYEINQEDSPLKITYLDGSIVMEVKGETEETYTFIIKDDNSFRLESGNIVYEIIKEGNQYYVLMAVKRGLNFEVVNLVFEYDEEIKTYSFMVYISEDLPTSLFDGIPYNYARKAGSIQSDG